jgi:hypothetical protein
MSELTDYEARASQADGFADAARSAEVAQEWRQIAAEYRLLADFTAVESSGPQPDEPLIGFSA